jgi:hypothetical protein
MAKTLKKRVKRLEAMVESLAKKVQALGGTAGKKKISKRRVKAAGTPPARKVKRAVVKPAAVKPATPSTPFANVPQSGAA